MTDQELTEIKTDLKEIKEMMQIISQQVGSDKEIAAQRTLRRMEGSRISKQIRQMNQMVE